jgi:hypothetical protein
MSSISTYADPAYWTRNEGPGIYQSPLRGSLATRRRSGKPSHGESFKRLHVQIDMVGVNVPANRRQSSGVDVPRTYVPYRMRVGGQSSSKEGLEAEPSETAVLHDPAVYDYLRLEAYIAVPIAVALINKRERR